MAGNKVISSHRMQVTAVECADGATGLGGLTYQMPSKQGGAEVIGNGTLQHPLAVKLTPVQAQASNLAESLESLLDLFDGGYLKLGNVDWEEREESMKRITAARSALARSKGGA